MFVCVEGGGGSIGRSVDRSIGACVCVCVCVDARAKPAFTSTPMLCSAVSSRHFVTFLGQRYDFYGLGLFSLVGTPEVLVQAVHTKWGRASANAGIAFKDTKTGEAVTVRAIGNGRLAVVKPDKSLLASGAGTATFCNGDCTVVVNGRRAVVKHLVHGITADVSAWGSWANMNVCLLSFFDHVGAR